MDCKSDINGTDQPYNLNQIEGLVNFHRESKNPWVLLAEGDSTLRQTHYSILESKGLRTLVAGDYKALGLLLDGRENLGARAELYIIGDNLLQGELFSVVVSPKLIADSIRKAHPEGRIVLRCGQEKVAQARSLGLDARVIGSEEAVIGNIADHYFPKVK